MLFKKKTLNSIYCTQRPYHSSAPVQLTSSWLTRRWEAQVVARNNQGSSEWKYYTRRGQSSYVHITWKRSCWISQMWQQSNQAGDGQYIIDWESPEVQQQIKDNIEYLTKGCSCKKGCKNLKCGWRKKMRKCGPGCLCQSCMNIDDYVLWWQW